MIFENDFFPVSVDLETLGLKPNAAIIQIGAAVFDPEGHILDSFSVTISPAGQRPAEADTLAWWLNQGDSGADTLRRAYNSPVGIHEALHMFSNWIRQGQDTKGVGKFGGPVLFRGNKDMSWLENAFDSNTVEMPFHFREVHEQRQFMRTAEYLGYDRSGMGERITSQHDALNDAIWQAKCAAAAVRHMDKFIQE